MNEKTTAFSILSDARIDREQGIISGVSVITKGKAKGHGMEIDSTCLEQVRNVASEFPNGVKVKFKHKTEKEFQSVVDETCGVIKNFSISGGKVIGNLHVFKSLAKETRDKIFEIAETIPDQFGLSIVFSGPTEEKDGTKFARCEELQSIDFADRPAANPSGLFNEPNSMSIKYKSGDSGAHAESCMCADCKDKSMEADKKRGEKKMEELEASIKNLTDLVTNLGKSAAPTTSLSYKNDRGELVQLSAEHIATALSTTTQLAADTKKAAELTAKSGVLDRIQNEGRVCMNPKTKVAYKLEELRELPFTTLEILADNSPKIPMEARAIYKGASDPKTQMLSDKNLKGSALTETWLESQGFATYESMQQMKSGHMAN